MTLNRFYNRLPDPYPRDSEIVKRATRLKIDLYRDKDGDLHGDMEIGCGFGCFAENDYGHDPDEFKRQQEESMRFVLWLLREFEQGKGGEAC